MWWCGDVQTKMFWWGRQLKLESAKPPLTRTRTTLYPSGAKKWPLVLEITVPPTERISQAQVAFPDCWGIREHWNCWRYIPASREKNQQRQRRTWLMFFLQSGGAWVWDASTIHATLTHRLGDKCGEQLGEPSKKPFRRWKLLWKSMNQETSEVFISTSSNNGFQKAKQNVHLCHQHASNWMGLLHRWFFISARERAMGIYRYGIYIGLKYDDLKTVVLCTSMI